MNTQQTLNALARLAGQDPIEVGDLADVPILGRVQVLAMLPAMQVEVMTRTGDRLTVRKQLLRKV